LIGRNKSIDQNLTSQEIVESLEGASVTPIGFQINGELACNVNLFRTQDGKERVVTLWHCTKDLKGLPFIVLSNFDRPEKFKRKAQSREIDDQVIAINYSDFKEYFRQNPQHKIVNPPTPFNNLLDKPYSKNCKPSDDNIFHFSALHQGVINKNSLYNFVLDSQYSFSGGNSGSAVFYSGIYSKSKKECIGTLGLIARGGEDWIGPDEIDNLIFKSISKLIVGLDPKIPLTAYQQNKLIEITGVNFDTSKMYFNTGDFYFYLDKKDSQKTTPILASVLGVPKTIEAVLEATKNPIPIELVKKIKIAFANSGIVALGSYKFDIEGSVSDELFQKIAVKFSKQVKDLIKHKISKSAENTTRQGDMARISTIDNDLVNFTKSTGFELVTKIVDGKIIIVDLILPSYTMNGIPLVAPTLAPSIPK
jgi:hypothetical protein